MTSRHFGDASAFPALVEESNIVATLLKRDHSCQKLFGLIDFHPANRVKTHHEPPPLFAGHVAQAQVALPRCKGVTAQLAPLVF